MKPSVIVSGAYFAHANRPGPEIVGTATISGHTVGCRALCEVSRPTDLELMPSRTWISLLLFISLVAGACGGPSVEPTAPSSAAPRAGEPAPVRDFELFDGSVARLADYSGKPVVLNFWASWCPSCVAEMSAAFRPVQERLGDDVTFIGMNIQDVRQLADDLLEETGVQWINALDPNGELYVELGGIGMPFTVFIAPSGNVIDEHNGPLNEQQLADRISALFGVSA